MLTEDPLDWFVHEKRAAEIPERAPAMAAKPYVIPKPQSPTAEDPGERALAGMVAVNSMLAPRLVQFVAGRAVGSLFARNSVENDGPAVMGARGFGDAKELLENMPAADELGTFKQRHRIMGLVDVERKYDPLLLAPGKPTDAYFHMQSRGDELGKLTDVVDSFITKHDLANKGVRLNLHQGPLSSAGGGSYNVVTREVTLPQINSALALHELGHAADYTSRMGKIRRHTDFLLPAIVETALPVALAAGDRIKEMIPGTVDDKAIAFMQDHAPGIMAATLATTTLYPEAKASFLAIRHMRDMERAGRAPVGAAMQAFKQLAPAWGTYLLGSVPAVVGMVLAKKYMEQARAEKRARQDDLAKTAGAIGSAAGWAGDYLKKEVRTAVNSAKLLGGLGAQLAVNTADLITQPHLAKKLMHAAKHVGTDPIFLYGAVHTAIPATLGAAYLYGTASGHHVRERLREPVRDYIVGDQKLRGKDEAWRVAHPMRFAGLVGLGAAMSGGILMKFFHDLSKAA